ncbi:class I SAM-dependent methyltransferase [Dyella sp. BiH032]|uniref:class I SAM-dependent methyltransferase n=1 Tax=Dyella sp. BiH032 TaxID=3075430 RepID=UPI0028934DCE|nr:class I SAM-dependent methyltransferase [Dyella sp. BiH032]WNL44363.1 class I SAM-dependent methyltransferase [Dyella sp. BiH032]
MNQAILLEPEAAYALWAQSYPAHAHNPVMQAEERVMLAMLPGDLRGQAVLDAGCGSGRYLLHARRRGAARLTGVDLSAAMLARAEAELSGVRTQAELALSIGSVASLPVADGTADVTVCGLVLGHVPDLAGALAELSRATRPGGTVLCSDFHPIGHALGWLRDFKVDGQRYAARHTPHLYSHWHRACAAAGLTIEDVREPMLDPGDIPPGARFDPAALAVPVALVFRLQRRR